MIKRSVLGPNEEMDRKRRGGYPEFAIVVIGSVFCLQYTLLYVLAVVLIYIFARRNGKTIGSIAALTSSALIIVLVGFKTLRLGVAWEDLLIISIGMFLPVMLGIFLFVLLTLEGLDRTGKILVGVIPVLLTGVVISVIYQGGGAAAEAARTFFRMILESFGEVFTSTMDGNSAEVVAWLISSTERVMMSTYVPSVVTIAGFGIYLAEKIPARVIFADRPEAIKEREVSSHDMLQDFSVPDQLIWVFIASWSIILIDLKFSVGLLGTIGWNIGLTVSLLYGAVGLSIISHLSAKRGKRVSPARLMFLCVLILLVPGANLLLCVIIPIIGISEIWIKFRAESKESPNENNT